MRGWGGLEILFNIRQLFVNKKNLPQHSSAQLDVRMASDDVPDYFRLTNRIIYFLFDPNLSFVKLNLGEVQVI